MFTYEFPRRIWLIDLAKEMPKATFDGLDISSAHLPRRNWLPANISLRELKDFGEIPPELVGKYDVVHVGLIVAGSRSQEELATLVGKLLAFLSKIHTSRYHKNTLRLAQSC